MTRGWRVGGFVQGVGFRWYVRQQAMRLGLVGYARNLADGSVEVVARGTEAGLAALEAALRRGAPASEVASVEHVNVPQDVQLSNSFETM